MPEHRNTQIPEDDKMVDVNEVIPPKRTEPEDVNEVINKVASYYEVP